MVNDLQSQLERDRQLWAAWLTHGVDEETDLTVDFFLYCKGGESAHRLADALESRGYGVVVVSRRTLLLFRRWTVEAQRIGKWSLERLHAASMELCALGDEHGAVYDGAGALMP
jgi:hypothetical protein